MSSDSPKINVITDAAVNNENLSTIQDARINCYNDIYLEKMLEIAIEKVEKLQLGQGKLAYMKAFKEAFLNVVQSNVTVIGLPWELNEKLLTSDEKESQKVQSIDALLSKLSKSLETLAYKRKMVPAECERILEIKQKHERQNLKNAKIISESLPSTPKSDGKPLTDGIMQKDYAKKLEELFLVQAELGKLKEKHQQLKEDFNLMHNISKRQNPNDTGYSSE